LLIDHFADHGAEFGAKSAAEYEILAGQFLTIKGNPDIQETIEEDGDIVRFNAKTNEFGILGPGGQIRTYYKPDPSLHGKRNNQYYFNGSR